MNNIGERLVVLLTASGTNNESAGLNEESFDVALAAFPVMNGEATDVAYKAEGGERRVKKQGEETPSVAQVPEGRGRFLGRHQHHERLPEVSRNLLEHVAVVRVDHHEERLPRERVQVAGVEAVGLLTTARPLSVLRITLAAR